MKFCKLLLSFIFVGSLITAISACVSSPSETDVRILVNQVGYYENSKKTAIVTNTDRDEISIKSMETDVIVYTASLTPPVFWDAAHENLRIADFSDFKIPGKYILVLAGNIESDPIEIRSTINRKPAELLLKSYYYQRAGLDILPIYGGKWNWKAGHLQDAECQFHPSTGKTGTWESPGGWYDAGDYGKYIVNGGITVGTILGFYELYPALIGDNLVIPESGNGISDLLDEVRYELEWMRTMQDMDGGVFFKLSGLKWPGMDVLPAADTQKRYIIGKSTTSTLNFCAVMAMAGRIYAESDASFSTACLTSAEKAWQWAVDNPNSAPPDTGIPGSGPYDDANFEDEFLWASAELYKSTGINAYAEWIRHHPSQFKVTSRSWWQNVRNLGVFSLVSSDISFDTDLIVKAKKSILDTANKYLEEIRKSPAQVPMDVASFTWGSHGNIGNKGIILAYAHYLTGDRTYLEGLLEIADYLSGRNATGYSSATGLGSNPPIFPHHRPSVADGIKEPVPGLVVGGPNPYKQDGLSYPNSAPARCYLDVTQSYSSNEPAINQNAAVFFVFAYMAAQE